MYFVFLLGQLLKFLNVLFFFLSFLLLFFPFCLWFILFCEFSLFLNWAFGFNYNLSLQYSEELYRRIAALNPLAISYKKRGTDKAKLTALRVETVSATAMMLGNMCVLKVSLL